MLISARQQFAVQAKEINVTQPDMKQIEVSPMTREQRFDSLSLSFQEKLFDIDILCPQNAPRRCEWCHGPYHIRKRCPKLAQLHHEQEKQRRMQMNPAGAYPPMQGYPMIYPQYDPHAAFLVQTYNDGTRTFYGRPQPGSANGYYQPNYPQQRQCFQCGSVEHVKAQCPQRRQNPERPRRGH